MMNGLLEEKKEKNLENQIVAEEWMKKDREDMNEEELAKYEEFLEKQEKMRDDQEKMRKILNQELKKIMADIKSACADFDEMISTLFIKRLEYQYRVYEQEMILVKLKQLLVEEMTLGKKLSLAKNGRESETRSLEEKQAICAYLKGQIEKENEVEAQLEAEVARLETKGLKQIWQTVIPNRDETSKRFVDFELRMERYGRENSFLATASRDPAIILEKKRLAKILEYEPDFYSDLVRDFLSKKFDNEYDIQNELTKFAKLLTAKRQAKAKTKEIKFYSKLLAKFERQVEEHRSKLAELESTHDAIDTEKEKHSANSFLMMRANNENIEVSREKPIVYNLDTILIHKDSVTTINKEIVSHGNKKIDLLICNLDEKRHVEQDLNDLKRLELEIKEAMIETLILTRLKVSKKLQTVIAKNDVKLMEHEEKNVRKQIEKLISSTEKSVSSFKKKELKMRKEINFISQENENLLFQGGILQESVSQRQEIFNMVFGKANGEDQATADQMGSSKQKFDDKAFKKTQELIQNRKLYDTAKRLAEEIEGLMKELKLLQKKSFPDIQPTI
jgi:hypothetical protein